MKTENDIHVLDHRKAQVYEKGKQDGKISCDKKSVSGSVSQRACAFCGSRVVLYPIADALHVVHGPIGCAVYNWDIRGALSSGPQLHRNSFSTDLREMDVIYGGEQKLEKFLLELIEERKPKAAFVYSTCIVGLIGDDVQMICKKVQKSSGLPIIAVDSVGFKGSKKSGYQAACEALYQVIEAPKHKVPLSINLMGDFNIAGESWLIKRYFEEMGIKVLSVLTGDGRVDEIRRSAEAELNIVQCSGSMTHLAKMMKKDHGIPFLRVSFFGIEDTAKALYDVDAHFKNDTVHEKLMGLIQREVQNVSPALMEIRQQLQGKKAALYVGGAFKAFSLVKALRTLGMKTVVAGTQTGGPEEYQQLKDICDDGTVLLDDSNPLELAKYALEKDIDLMIGGVKERPIAYKLGMGFCDHNHERKIPLAGFVGMLNFAKEVRDTVLSPVWSYTKRRSPRGNMRAADRYQTQGRVDRCDQGSVDLGASDESSRMGV